MDRNTIIGFVLIGILLIVFSIYNQPTKEEQARQIKMRDSLEHVQRVNDSMQHVERPVVTATPDSKTVSHQVVDSIPEKTVAIENDEMIVTFSSKGAIVKSVMLKKHKTWDGKPLYLFNPENREAGFQILTSSGEIKTSQLSFTTDQADSKISGNNKSTVT